MTQEPAQQEPYRRGMVVVAHADDAEFSCSGTVARWCKEGMEVAYVIVTDGSKGTDDRSIAPERLAEMRRQEQISAGKVLGLKEVIFLGYPDAYLQPSLEVRRDITREIRRFRPDIVITLNPTRSLSSSYYLGHPDHFAAGEAALSAVFPAARDHLTFPELLKEGLEPHKVREVLVVGHDQPDKWVDVSDSLPIAMQALMAHASQIGPEAVERMKEWRKEAGKEKGLQYAEAFKSILLS